MPQIPGQGAQRQRAVATLVAQGHRLVLKTVCSDRWWWLCCLVCAAAQAWNARHYHNADGLSYLDLASEALRSGPAALQNAYWSPAYPALLSLGLFLFRPSPDQELVLVHAVNFLIFAAALWSFSFFLRQLRGVAWDAAPPGSPARPDCRVPLAYLTFLLFTLRLIGLHLITPDLAIAAVVFLAAGIGCRLFSSPRRWHCAALGLVLGLGYYMKAAFLPAGFALWALMFACSLIWGRRGRSGLLLSLAVFLTVIAPWIGITSARAQRLSIGEAGRLNYVWAVNGLQAHGGWTGQHPELYGRALHPPRVLLQEPLVLEFASPVAGTFPLWLDPSYWYAGAKATFSVSRQAKAIAHSAITLGRLLPLMSPWIAGAMVLFGALCAAGRRPALPVPSIWLIAWPITASCMYALVWIETRYVAPFVILFWVVLYGASGLGTGRRALRPVVATVACAATLAVLGTFLLEVRGIAGEIAHPSPPPYQVASGLLGGLGLRPGARLALAGNSFDAYFARHGRMRIVAWVPDQSRLWRMAGPELEVLKARLAGCGVQALVAPGPPSGAAAEGWRWLRISESERWAVLPVPAGPSPRRQ